MARWSLACLASASAAASDCSASVAACWCRRASCGEGTCKVAAAEEANGFAPASETCAVHVQATCARCCCHHLH